MDKDEALKLALDCLEDIFGKEKIDVGAINALRQAIAEAERQESDDLTIAYMAGLYDGKNKYAPQPEQEPVAWLTKELMANYLDTIAEAIEANRSEMLRHKAHKLRDRGEI